MTNSPVKKKRAGRPKLGRHEPFFCLVNKDLFAKAKQAKPKGVTWPGLVESMMKETINGIDHDYLKIIATQAIIALENQQRVRYGLIARRLRKALNLEGASKETMVQSIEEYGK